MINNEGPLYGDGNAYMFGFSSVAVSRLINNEGPLYGDGNPSLPIQLLKTLAN